MPCIELKICLVLQQNPAPNFGTTYFFLFTKQKNKILFYTKLYLSILYRFTKIYIIKKFF
jgi:hypothetical protein